MVTSMSWTLKLPSNRWKIMSHLYPVTSITPLIVNTLLLQWLDSDEDAVPSLISNNLQTTYLLSSIYSPVSMTPDHLDPQALRPQPRA